MFRTVLLSALLAAAACSAQAADPGVTDSEIKLGQTMPYSGPASGYAITGRVEAAYYEMINAKGGVNGRKIKFISLDDAYSPSKTVEQTRKLVEQEEVFAIVGSLGTPTNSAVQRYLNNKKVPQVFISTGASKWNNPKNYPYTLALYPPYRLEGATFARYLLANRPNAKVGTFSQNDDAGRDYLAGFKEALGDKAGTMIVKEVTYEPTDATVDTQIVQLKAAGVDTLYTGGTSKYVAQVIRKVAELGWKPLNYVVSTGSSIKGVLEPAGIGNSKGLITTLAYKTATDPRWQGSADVKEFRQFVKDWMPEADLADGSLVTGYVSAFMTVKVLELCGKDLTRENFIRIATTLTKIEAPMLLPGITITTRPDNYAAFSQMQMARFDGTSWVPEGPVISINDALH
jgi:ABC-type branched-subunit amino acid transport system substrate-binding protein